ncbi:hypothetical protein [Streptomyces sp. TN58]|uniref:hypothetical protein n=1 Tax=Streptomyces sp. TN58 TaxID=234612 RepID=UPI0009506B4E|nr:hypothetical protein [Streptomyces sp. TN58]APU43406.1 hypothetical protein BSL84_30260 [Streptomyces sp. TN58]
MSTVKQMLGAAAITGILLATVACGGEKADPKPSSDPMQAFQECLKQHGVTMPDRGGQRPEGMRSGRPEGAPSGRPSGMPSGRPEGMPSGRPEGAPSGRPSGMPSMSAEQQEAMQACASLRPQRGGGGSGANGEQSGG